MATQPPGPVKTLRMSREPAAAPIVDNPKLKPMAGSQPVVKRIVANCCAWTIKPPAQAAIR